MATHPPSVNPFESNQIWVGEEIVRNVEALPPGISVNFHPRSTGNVVRFAAKASWKGISIDLSSAINCEVTVGRIRVHFGGVRVSFVANNQRYSTSVSVSIGDGCTFNGSTHIIGPLTPGLSVRIGRNCLFASNVSIRGSSHHGLWDKDTGRLLNPEVGIEIGDHVWLGDQVVVLNKARIAAGSVVGARSVVNKSFSETHALLAGIPAAVRRSNVDWTNEFPIDNGLARRS